MKFAKTSFPGVIIHPCMRKYRVNLFSELAECLDVSVIESDRPVSGSFVSKERDCAIALCSAKFVERSKYRIPFFRNSNLSVFRILSRKYKFVIFSSFTSFPFLFLSLPARILKKKIFVFSETISFPESGKHKMLKALYRFFARRFVDGWLVSGSKAYTYTRLFVGESADIRLCINSHTDYSNALLGNERSNDLLYLGRIERIKGLDLVIKALRYTDKNLIVYGDGSELHSCRKLSTSLGLNERIAFNGVCDRNHVEHIMEKYRNFILPSRYMPGQAQTEESWGFTVNEALERGCKVLVSDSVGSATDLVMEGINGFTFQSGNVEDLANKINQLDSVKTSPSEIREYLRKRCDNNVNARLVADMINSKF